MQVFAALLLMGQQLTKLAPVDVLILVLYFALVTLAAMVIWPKAGATRLNNPITQASGPQASFPVA